MTNNRGKILKAKIIFIFQLHL